MANSRSLLSKSVHVHPVFLLGVGVLLVALGAVFAETVFAAISAVTGVSVLVSAAVWAIVSVITMLLGVARSFEVVDDAQ